MLKLVANEITLHLDIQRSLIGVQCSRTLPIAHLRGWYSLFPKPLEMGVLAGDITAVKATPPKA